MLLQLDVDKCSCVNGAKTMMSKLCFSQIDTTLHYIEIIITPQDISRCLVFRYM